MYALGIDLGTTFTAAAVWRQHHAEIASLGGRTAAIPSVVLLRADDTFVVGEAANRRAMSEPHRVAREFKRRLGDTTPILLAGSPYSAEALMARLLRAVVDEVSAREGGAPSKICVSHPANWGPYKLDLLQQAVRLSGVQAPVTFTSEPQAAAVFYAQQQRIEPGAVVAVYDLGGGTFDAAVLRKTATGFEMLGQPEGIERLGGIDFDAAVFNHVAKALGTKLSELDEDDPAVIAAVARLREECTQAKEALSADTDASIPVLLPNVTTEVRITRAEFEAMVRPSLHDTIGALKRALQSAGVADDVHSVLLVGGSSRMPIVAQMVGAELGRPVSVDAHPKHAVALGAAWIASGATAEPPAPERVKGRATPAAAPVSPVMPMSPPVPLVAKPVVPAQRVAPVSPVAATVITPSPLAPRPEPVRSSGVAPTIPMRAETVRSAPERPRQHVPAPPPVYSDRSGDSRGRSRAPVLAGVAVGLVIALSVLAFVLLKDKNRHNGGVDLGSIGTNDVTTPVTSNPPTTDTPPTTAPPPPVSYPKTASAYATAATKAWATGDAVRLGQLSDPDNAVFATLSAGDYNKAFALFKCTDDAGLNTCVFYNKFGDQLNLVVQNDLVGSAHAVVDGQFTQITFPVDLKEYAQVALDDWQRHNKAAVSLLTGKPGDSAFSAIPDGRRNDTWTYDHEEGATGHVFYIWKNPAGESIAISFAAPGSVTIPPNRHGLIETVYFMPPP